MHTHELVIEKTYEEHTALLEEFRDCLEKERASLMNVDVDRLWMLMEKKNGLAMDVQRTGNEIKHLLGESFPDSKKTPRFNALKEWPWYRAMNAKTMLLKEDIRVRLDENHAFIRDSLGFLDELMHIIVQSGGKGEGYRHLQNPQEKPTARIYQREV